MSEMRDAKLVLPAVYIQRAPLKKLLGFKRIKDRLYVQVRSR